MKAIAVLLVLVIGLAATPAMARIYDPATRTMKLENTYGRGHWETVERRVWIPGYWETYWEIIGHTHYFDGYCWVSCPIYHTWQEWVPGYYEFYYETVRVPCSQSKCCGCRR